MAKKRKISGKGKGRAYSDEEEEMEDDFEEESAESYQPSEDEDEEEVGMEMEDEDEEEPEPESEPEVEIEEAAEADREPADSDEEWLDALDNGELDGRGEVRRDNANLTQRQRAILGVSAGEAYVEPLMELPNGGKGDKMGMTEEEIAKKEEQARKRKLVVQQKVEETKLAVVDKLLRRKVSNKLRKEEEKKEKIRVRIEGAHTRYIQRKDGASLSVTADTPMPIRALTGHAPHVRDGVCGNPGCGNARKYTCSTSHVPLCSLACYKAIRSNAAFAQYFMGALSK